MEPFGQNICRCSDIRFRCIGSRAGAASRLGLAADMWATHLGSLDNILLNLFTFCDERFFFDDFGI